MAAIAAAMSIAIRGASTGSVGHAASAASRGTAEGRGTPRPDDWLDALAKLVPGEVILAFHAALRVIGVGASTGAHIAILVIFTSIVPVLLWESARKSGARAPWLQYVVRTLAFALYGFGSDLVLDATLRPVDWMVGALVIALLTALVLSPPGAQRPPPGPSDRTAER